MILVPDTVIADMFEKKEVMTQPEVVKRMAAGAGAPPSGKRKSMLTVQLEQMKEQSNNPFSRFAKYDGKVRHSDVASIIARCEVHSRTQATCTVYVFSQMFKHLDFCRFTSQAPVNP